MEPSNLSYFALIVILFNFTPENWPRNVCTLRRKSPEIVYSRRTGKTATEKCPRRSIPTLLLLLYASYAVPPVFYYPTTLSRKSVYEFITISEKCSLLYRTPFVRNNTGTRQFVSDGRFRYFGLVVVVRS